MISRVLCAAAIWIAGAVPLMAQSDRVVALVLSAGGTSARADAIQVKNSLKRSSCSLVAFAWARFVFVPISIGAQSVVRWVRCREDCRYKRHAVVVKQCIARVHFHAQLQPSREIVAKEIRGN